MFVYREIVDDKRLPKLSDTGSFEDLQRLNTIDLIRHKIHNSDSNGSNSGSDTYSPVQEYGLEPAYRSPSPLAGSESESHDGKGETWYNLVSRNTYRRIDG